jgi:hypothetical protein
MSGDDREEDDEREHGRGPSRSTSQSSGAAIWFCWSIDFQ